jgi:hypothetical protein
MLPGVGRIKKNILAVESPGGDRLATAAVGSEVE